MGIFRDKSEARAPAASRRISRELDSAESVYIIAPDHSISRAGPGPGGILGPSAGEAPGLPLADSFMIQPVEVEVVGLLLLVKPELAAGPDQDKGHGPVADQSLSGYPAGHADAAEIGVVEITGPGHTVFAARPGQRGSFSHTAEL